MLVPKGKLLGLEYLQYSSSRYYSFIQLYTTTNSYVHNSSEMQDFGSTFTPSWPRYRQKGKKREFSLDLLPKSVSFLS